MDDKYLPRHEHEEYAKRMEDEHKRQNHRIGALEKALEQNNKLLISVERLALSMENMQKEQKEQGERLEVLESRDGEMWRAVVEKVVMILVGAFIGYALKQLGL